MKIETLIPNLGVFKNQYSEPMSFIEIFFLFSFFPFFFFFLFLSFLFPFFFFFFVFLLGCSKSDIWPQFIYDFL